MSTTTHTAAARQGIDAGVTIYPQEHLLLWGLRIAAVAVTVTGLLWHWIK